MTATHAPEEATTANAGSPVAQGPELQLPRWFCIGLAGALAFVAAAGFAGVVLLVLGAYQPILVLILAIGGATLTARAIAARIPKSSARTSRPAIAAVAIAIIFLAMTAAFHSEHLLTDTDPAVYINMGRSIAAQHTLAPTIRSGPFKSPDVVVSSPFFYETKAGRQQTSFLPMLPVLLALGWTLGGMSGMLAVPALLGALGLLAIFAFAAQMVPSRWALIAPILLLINPLQSWFARDAYSELVVQSLALGGIWLYLEARKSLSPRLAAISGALIAAALLARFDVLAVIAGAVVFAAIEVARASDTPSPERLTRVVAVFVAALIGVGAYARFLTVITSSEYLNEHRSEVRPLSLLVVGAVGFGAIVLAIHRIRPGVITRVVRRPAFYLCVAPAALAGACYTYFLRPAPASAAYSLRSTADAASLPNRAQWLNAQLSWSMRWLTAWFGPVAVLLAIVGILVLLRRALRGDVPATALMLVVVPLTVILILRPSVSPDQPWAMRRFVPVVIPGLAIGVAVSLHALTRLARRSGSAAAIASGRVALVVLAVLAVAPSVAVAAPLVRAREQHGAVTAVQKLCHALPHNAVVLIFPANSVVDDMTQTVRGFCEVPTAWTSNPHFDVVSLARSWADDHKTLYIVTSSPPSVDAATHGQAAPVLHVTIDDAYAPQDTYRVPPRRFVPQPREFWLERTTIGPAHN
jgi:hypothetical protein